MIDGKEVGIVFSCFDLFHAGHVLMLKEAKEQCDYLIACLQSDPTIDRPEKNKPVQSLFERYVQLSACKYVDEVLVYATEQEVVDILLSYPVDVRIIGEEYKDRPFTGKHLAEAHQHDLYFNSRRHDFSTTSLRDRIVKASQ